MDSLPFLCLAVAAFVMVYGAIMIEVCVFLFQYNGDHTPSSELIIADDSVEQCIVQMNDSTSISQFAVETLPGLIVLLSMTLIGSFLLITISRERTNWIPLNMLGYVALGLVGIFSDQLPGTHPRRDYNFLLLWPVSSSITNVFHITFAAAFLFLPLVGSGLWLYKYPHRWWILSFAFNLCLNASYGAVDLWASGGIMTPGQWWTFEVGAFAYTYINCAAFELWQLHQTKSNYYFPLKR